MSSNKNTIIILTPGFAQDEADSTCLPLQQQLIRALRIQDPEINLVVLALQYPFRKEQYSWFGLPVIPFDGRSRGGLAKLLLRRKIFRTLKEINRQTPIKALLSFWCGECAAVGKAFADKYSLKHFCWILGQDAKKENIYPRKIKPRSTELVALSDFLQDEFEKNHGLRPAHMIPAGVNLQLIDTVIKEKNIDILGVGSFIPLKRYHLFVQIIAIIKSRLPQLSVTLVGDGPAKEQLLQLISEYRLHDCITMVGKVAYEDVLHLMSRSKILLHPSSYEGFSGVCLEALAAGAHVISFCRAMNTEINHWHIVKTKEEMTEKAISLLTGRQDEYSMVQPYLIEKTAGEFLRVFQLG
jgi:glycosyltransferase involved in cell wall biosynthesis